MEEAPPASHREAADWERVKQLVADALERTDEARRQLLAELADEPEVLAAVQRLLGAADASAGVLHPDTDAFLGLTGAALGTLGGQRFGRYDLVRLVGEGAAGAVYEARQPGLERPVALKLLRSHLLASDAEHRFRREVEALGRLEHPNIARIFEAGIHRDGDGRRVPFIAMEFVPGEPLTSWVRASHAGPRQCVQLLAQVADAVHAAHQRAVIHRDLKPGNVLVTPLGVPKVVDFSIAHVARESDGTVEQSVRTTAGLLLGTLGYMAPEQAAGEPDAATDVRTDVWALGVLLYEVLAGRPPIDIRGLPLPAALRRLHESEPAPLPIGGDLQTIVSTALAGDKASRYASAKELADDLRRWLLDEPIAAKPPSTLYLAGKFVRRHRMALAVAVAIAGLLVAGTVASTIGFVREASARRQAVAAQAEAEAVRLRAEDALAIAQRENRRSQSARAFLQRVVSSADPDVVAGGSEVTLLQALLDAEPELTTFAGGEPQVEAEIRTALARALRSLGEEQAAAEQYALALERARQVEGMPLAAVDVMIEQAGWLADIGRAAEAAPLAEEAEVLLNSNYDVRGAGPRLRLQLASVRASLLDAQGQWQDAAELWQEVLPEAQALTDPAEIYGPAGDPSRLSVDELQTMRNNASLSYLNAGRFAEAAAELQQVVAWRSQTFGQDHMPTLYARSNLAYALAELGETVEAERRAREVIGIAAEKLGPGHDIVGSAQGLLIQLLTARGTPEALDEAIELARQRLAVERDRGDAGHDMVYALSGVAASLGYARRWEEAVPYAREGLAVATQHLGPDHPDTITARGTLANLLAQVGEVEPARQELAQVVADHRRVNGRDSVPAIIAQNNLAMLRFDHGGDLTLAESELAECVEIARRMEYAFVEPVLLRNLGRVQARLGRHGQAEASLLASWQLSSQTPGTHRTKLIGDLADLYDAMGNLEEAARWRGRLEP